MSWESGAINSKWQREFQARGTEAFPSSGARKPRTTEITRLKRELARVTEACDILKKPPYTLPRSPGEVRLYSDTPTGVSGDSHVSRLAGEPEWVLCWQRRETSARTQANQRLIERMRVLHQQTREAYRARKMWQLLKREGLNCGRHRVARLRRLARIVALRRRRYIRTVQVRQHETAAIPNRLNQQFAVSA